MSRRYVIYDSSTFEILTKTYSKVKPLKEIINTALQLTGPPEDSQMIAIENSTFRYLKNLKIATIPDILKHQNGTMK